MPRLTHGERVMAGITKYSLMTVKEAAEKYEVSETHVYNVLKYPESGLILTPRFITSAPGNYKFWTIKESRIEEWTLLMKYYSTMFSAYSKTGETAYRTQLQFLAAKQLALAIQLYYIAEFINPNPQLFDADEKEFSEQVLILVKNCVRKGIKLKP